MCISKVDQHQDKCAKMNRSNIGGAIRGVLSCAKAEHRLICGLLQAITYLEEKPDDALLCLLPETRPGDAASHMQTVLLQAFCYENYIPVIMVDSAERLAELCGLKPSNRKATSPVACPCAIVSRDPNIPWDSDSNPPLSPGEKTLQDFYECTLEEFPRPVIQLPI